MWLELVIITTQAYIGAAFKPAYSHRCIGLLGKSKGVRVFNTIHPIGDETNSESIGSAQDSLESVDSLSPEFQRLLIGLIVYKSKYGNYNVPKKFVFGTDVDSRIVKYRLGQIYHYTMDELALLSGEADKLDEIERRPGTIPLDELKNAHKYFRLIHLDTSQITKLKRAHDLKINSHLIKPSYGKRADAPRAPKVDNASADPNMIYDEFLNSYHDKRIIDKARETAKEGEKVILQYAIDDYNRKHYKPLQKLPLPSDRPQVRQDIVKTIIDELLQAYQETDNYLEQIKAGINPLPCLVPSSTRRDREGGHHYEFFHWTFEDFVGALIHFNNLYHTYNYEKFQEAKKNGTAFTPLTFNCLERIFEVDKSEFWPEKWHQMPLGHFIHSIRDGDIDAKDHWLRRPILDRIRFDWGDGLRHLSFTWELLMKGIYWMLNVRGEAEIAPDLVLPKDALVVRFGRPEEIQGLKIGYMLDVALQQSQVLFQYYPERYRFLEHSVFQHIPQRGLVLGYRPEPHYRYNPDIKGLQLSNTGKLFLGDHTDLSNYFGQNDKAGPDS